MCIRDRRKAVLGPWIHSFNSRYDIHGVPMGLQAIRYDVDLLYFQWASHHICAYILRRISSASIHRPLR